MENEFHIDVEAPSALKETEQMLVELYRKSSLPIKSSVLIMLTLTGSPDLLKLIEDKKGAYDIKVLESMLKKIVNQYTSDKSRTIVVHDDKKISFNKFTEEQLKSIKYDLHHKKLSIAATAKKYQVSRNLIYKVKNMG